MFGEVLGEVLRGLGEVFARFLHVKNLLKTSKHL